MAHDRAELTVCKDRWMQGGRQLCPCHADHRGPRGACRRTDDHGRPPSLCERAGRQLCLGWYHDCSRSQQWHLGNLPLRVALQCAAAGCHRHGTRYCRTFGVHRCAAGSHCAGRGSGQGFSEHGVRPAGDPAKTEGEGSVNVLFGLVSAMFVGATPILLAAIGGTFTFYAGIFNIAMEGMMLVGAFCAVLGSFFLHSWFLGVLCAIAGALIMAGIFILFAVKLHTDEFLTGIALNLFAVGLTTFLLRDIFHVKGAFTDAGIQAIPAVKLPVIGNIPFLGRLLSGYNVIVYVAVIATVLCAYIIFHTRFGLRLRGAGYNAACLSSSGVSPSTIRIWSLVICAICCGLAGAYLSLGYVRLFAENMSAGRGWISLTAIILVSGNPWGIAIISLLFGFFDGLTVFLQGSRIPTQFTAMIPYLATLISLYFYSVRKRRRT